MWSVGKNVFGMDMMVPALYPSCNVKVNDYALKSRIIALFLFGCLTDT
jgi:hypothetical protein